MFFLVCFLSSLVPEFYFQYCKLFQKLFREVLYICSQAYEMSIKQSKIKIITFLNIPFVKIDLFYVVHTTII